MLLNKDENKIGNIFYRDRVIRNDEDGIPDYTLYRFALEALHCQPEEFTEKKAATLKELKIDTKMIEVNNDWVPEYRLESLKGITFLSNLIYLNIGLNELRNISPVSYLHHLCELSVNGPIRSLEPIRKLQSLRIVDFCGCDFEDISPLTELTNLEELTICSCGISDIYPIGKLKNLRKLGLTNNCIRDLRPIIALTKLQCIELDENSFAVSVETMILCVKSCETILI
jgi:internalin A